MVNVNRHCQNCGADATESQSFCGSCGADLRTDMSAHYCHNCGTAGDRFQGFCGSCGADWRQLNIGNPSRLPAATTSRFLDYRIPLGRVLLMTALSCGLYLAYWFYITWKQFRDHTNDPQAYPVWHAFTLLVPIYSYFRFHYHVSVYEHLMAGLDQRASITTGTAVLLIVLANVVGGTGSYYGFGEESISQSDAVFSAVLSIVSTAMVMWVLHSVQTGLNSYWDAFTARSPGVLVGDANVGLVEIVLVIFGALYWVTVISQIASESIRTGTY